LERALKYLLDTNACIDIIRHPKSKLALRFLSTPIQDIGVSVVSVAELWVGPFRKNRSAGEGAKVRRFLLLVNIVPVDETCAAEFGKIAASLLDAGTPIGTLDIQIAATAINHGLCVVTRNLRHFSIIPGLQFEDWEA
jgi:tRNA(fMet)-specific endonuclease VapC